MNNNNLIEEYKLFSRNYSPLGDTFLRPASVGTSYKLPDSVVSVTTHKPVRSVIVVFHTNHYLKLNHTKDVGLFTSLNHTVTDTGSLLNQLTLYVQGRPAS